MVQPDRIAHRDYRCMETAIAGSRSTSFNGTCRSRGISPLLGFRKILRNPNWNIFEEEGEEKDRPPPQPPPPPSAPPEPR